MTSPGYPTRSGVSFARPVDRRCGERRCLPDNRYYLQGLATSAPQTSFMQICSVSGQYCRVARPCAGTIPRAVEAHCRVSPRERPALRTCFRRLSFLEVRRELYRTNVPKNLLLMANHTYVKNLNERRKHKLLRVQGQLTREEVARRLGLIR